MTRAPVNVEEMRARCEAAEKARASIAGLIAEYGRWCAAAGRDPGKAWHVDIAGERVSAALVAMNLSADLPAALDEIVATREESAAKDERIADYRRALIGAGCEGIEDDPRRCIEHIREVEGWRVLRLVAERIVEEAKVRGMDLSAYLADAIDPEVPEFTVPPPQPDPYTYDLARAVIEHVSEHALAQAEAEVDALRARIRELEAPGECQSLHRLRARVAELEAERDSVPRHLRIAIAHATRAFARGDLGALGTINEDIQPLVDEAIAYARRLAGSKP